MGELTRSLGELVTWRPGTPEESEVYAIFGNGFQRVQAGELRVSSQRPELMVRLADLPSEPQEGYEVMVRGSLFTVASKPQMDVEAVSANLVLKKA